MNPEEFKCGMCSLFLVDAVKLPCCNNNVCGSHLKLLKDIPNNVICEICHDVFGPNQFQDTDSIKGLQFDPQLSINELKETLESLDKIDPEYLVYGYYEDLKRLDKGKIEIRDR